MTRDFSRSPNRRVLAALLAAVVGVGLCGCSKSGPKDWEVNGYLDTVTGYKFYTDKDVFAEKSPVHPDDRFVQVLVFIYPRGNSVIAARDAQNLEDPQTHKTPVSVRYPTEAELKAWGAVKATRQEVCN